MRAFEWVVLFSFLPAILLPLIPTTVRRRWAVLAAFLPLVAIALHLAVEGWRIQLAALYVMAPVVLLALLPVMRGRERGLRRGLHTFRSLAAAAIVLASALLAGWLLPVVSLPAPTGPYPVGIFDRELRDDARDRRLMVSVWYPAAQTGSPAPLTHFPDVVAAGLELFTGLPAVAFQHFRHFKVAAGEGVPLAGSAEPFPVLVFSHGLSGLRLQNSSALQELASWGYIVVALDHTDAATVTVFPDGDAVYVDLAKFGLPEGRVPEKEEIDDAVFPVWVADQRFVYDTIEQWNAGDPLLAGRLDLSRLGSFGHSFGGATSLEVCRVDQRCRAAADLDGGLYGGLLREPAVAPLMLITSEESAQFAEAAVEWQRLVDTARADAYWLQLPGSTHFSFTITQLLSPFLVPPGFDPRAGLRVTDTYLRAFFDRHLRGMRSDLLDPSSGTADMRWMAGGQG